MIPLAWGALALAGVLLLRSSKRPDPDDQRRRAVAHEVLGLKPGANRDQIHAAWRIRIAEHHPDRGGHPDDAARVNAARDFLLSQR